MNSCAKIETGVDRLLRLVAERREISFTDAANHLRVDPVVLELWTQTLEDRGMIATRPTLSDTMLCSAQHASASKARNMLGYLEFKRARLFNETDLREKNKECTQLLKQADERLAKAKKYESLHKRTLKLADVLSTREEKLAAQFERLTKERALVLEKGRKLLERAAAIERREAQLAARERELELMMEKVVKLAQ